MVKLAITILNKAYGKLGFQITCREFPPERALLYANNGTFDGELGRRKGINRKYKNLIMIDTPLFYAEEVVITNKADLKIYGWESLKPYRVGIIRGAKIPELKTRGTVRHLLNKPVQLIKMMEFKRIDVGILTRYSAVIELNKLKINNIRIVDPPLMRTAVYHYLNRKNSDMIPKIAKILKNMKKRGELQKAYLLFIKNLQSDH